MNAGFDYDQWQTMNQPQLATGGGTEPETPESVTQGAIDSIVQSVAKLFGVSPDLKGHGIVAETNVGSALPLQSTAIIKDRPGACSRASSDTSRESCRAAFLPLRDMVKGRGVCTERRRS